MDARNELLSPGLHTHLLSWWIEFIPHLGYWSLLPLVEQETKLFLPETSVSSTYLTTRLPFRASVDLQVP